MFRRLVANLGFFAAAVVVLLAGTRTSRAEQQHHFTIYNNSGNTLSLNWVSYCVKYNDKTSLPGSISPGQTATVYWDDSNDAFQKSSRFTGCAGDNKWVAFAVTGGPGGIYQGYLGIVHREFGSDWYNGEFYAQSLSLDDASDGLYPQWSDGNQPSSSVVLAHCAYENTTGCFGSYSEMVNAGKDSFNWAREYRTEDGWSFEIDNQD